MPESLPAVLRRDLTDREQAILTHGSRSAREVMLNVEGIKNEAMAAQQLAAVRAKCASLLRPAFASVVAEANGNGNGHHAAPAPPAAAVEPESDTESDTASLDDGLSDPPYVDTRPRKPGALMQLVMDYVCEHEPVRQADVRNALGIKSTEMPPVVSRLVKRRLIERGRVVNRSPLLSCTPGLAARGTDEAPLEEPERTFEEKFSGAFPADGQPPEPSPELTPPHVPADLIGPAGDEPGDGLDADHPNYWRQRMLDPDRPTMDMVPRSSHDGLPENEDIGAGDVEHAYDIVKARYALALLRHIEVGNFEPDLLDRFERIVGLSDSRS